MRHRNPQPSPPPAADSDVDSLNVPINELSGGVPQNEHPFIYLGTESLAAGQSSSEFRAGRLRLCYQCCKRIPYESIASTRNIDCGATSCCRTRRAGLPFIPMPASAYEACDKFTTMVLWWMELVDRRADESSAYRARIMVGEARADVPEVCAELEA